ncbi:type VI secretion system contractile sheath small subunit [Candidatus Sororendozoicomonas aggregata]|uniref:type VI secretion system contractile sheath small subunit n=1 Tax=Candidatus Sororendozoicomonas aggregata TaxID=3073239 RepID=UPI002ED5F3C5
MGSRSQHNRITKNRVSITYDVETNGAIEKRELPFVAGVIGDFSGSKPVEKRMPVEERKFVDVNKDNFSQVMRVIGPELSLRVPNKIDEESETELSVELSFTSMKDFEPENIAQQVLPLRNLLENRKKLRELLAHADRSDELEQLLKDVLQNTESLSHLSKELGVEVSDND